jgi:hypothetical protein
MSGFSIAAATFILDKGLVSIWATLAVASFGIALAAAVLGVLALQRFDEPPDPGVLVDKFGSESEGVILGALIGTKAAAFRYNLRTHRRKVLSWRLLLAALAAGVVFSSLSEVTRSESSVPDPPTATSGEHSDGIGYKSYPIDDIGLQP